MKCLFEGMKRGLSSKSATECQDALGGGLGFELDTHVGKMHVAPILVMPVKVVLG